MSEPPLPQQSHGSAPDRSLYATFGRRVGAYLIDAIPPIAFYLIFYVVLFASLANRSTGGVSASLIIGFGPPVAYFILLWAMAAKGSSPGKALLGIRVVRERDGSYPGIGLGLGRLLLMALFISFTLYIAGFSPLWDSSGRRKGWWDSAVGTVVLNLPAVAGYRATARGESVFTSTNAAPSVPGLQSAPAPDSAPHQLGPPPGMDVPPWDLPPVRAEERPVDAPVAGWSDRPAASAVPPPPGWSDRPAVESPPPPPGWSDRPAVEWPPPPPAWSDRPVAGFPPPPPAPMSMPSVAAPSVPASGAPNDAHATYIPAGDELPWASSPVAASGMIDGIPGPPRGGGSDSLEHTRMSPPKSPAPPTSEWELRFDDGRTLVLRSGVIVGRDPAAGPDEQHIQLLALGDEGRSVSKTHLRLDAGPAGVQVVDRHSTNGVTVITAGVPLACVPGVPTPVPAESTIRFGDRHLVVHRL